MFYLTTHSTHFIYGYMASDIIMVKYHTDSDRGNPLSVHGLLFPINSKGSFICIIPHTGLHIPRPLLHQSWSTGWNEKLLNGSDPTTHRTMSERSYHGATSHSYNSLMGAPCEGSIRRPIAPWVNTLTTELHLTPTIAQWVHPMKDRSDDPSHHEGTLLPRSYISLLQ